MREQNPNKHGDFASTTSTQSIYDSIVIGGGPAGLSAALILGRSLRRTLVFDSGEYRNAPANAVHGFLAQDGVAPNTLRQRGREDLSSYDTVTYQQTTVENIDQSGDEFVVAVSDGRTITTRTVILATGVKLELPSIDGLADLWGSTVIQCPYCHGWEIRNETHAVYAPRPEVMAYTAIIDNWSGELTLLTDGNSWLNKEHRDRLAANDVKVDEKAIAAIKGNDKEATVVFKNGEQLTVSALWIVPDDVHQRSPLADALGCSFTDHGLIETDGHSRSSIDGVYVAGDMSREHQLVSFAVGDGAMAGTMANIDLSQNEFRNS